MGETAIPLHRNVGDMRGQLERNRPLVGWLLIALALVVGCNRTIPPKVTADDGKRLGAIAFAYQRAGEQLGRPPQSIADLQPHLKISGDPAELLTSPRDGQPYVIVWGVDLNAPFGTELPVLAHEKQGKGGERMVLNLMGIVVVTDEEFAKLKLPRPEVTETKSN